MQLVREVLDKQIVDRNGFKTGKVDDLQLELREDEWPVVREIVSQHGALAQRLGKTMMRVGEWLREKILGMSPDVEPTVIGWEHVTHIDVVVHLDLDRNEAGVLRSEQAVWDRWIRHLPFAER